MQNSTQLVLYLAAVFGGEVRGDRLLLPFSLPNGGFAVHSIAPKQGISHNRYLVSLDGKYLRCSCPHHQFRGVDCKHINLVRGNVLDLQPEPEYFKAWQKKFG
jgi:SWIM zinc finger